MDSTNWHEIWDSARLIMLVPVLLLVGILFAHALSDAMQVAACKAGELDAGVQAWLAAGWR